MIFLDACVIIYWVEMAEPQFGQLAVKLNSISKQYGHLPFAVSQLSLLECRVKPLREDNKEILQQYQQFFTAKNLTQVALTPAVIESATALRAHYSLTTPDALQAASALSITQDQLFVTNDAVFKKIKGLKVISL
jgi:uncharacterized protein